MKSKWIDFVLIAVLICCGLAVIVPKMDISIGYDEACTVDFVRMVPGDITGMLAEGNNLPAYYFFMKVWTNIFGFGEGALRVPGIIFYIMSALVVYIFGRRLFPGRGPAFVSAVFYILMRINTAQAVNARPYGMLGFLSIVSIWLFYEIYIKNNNNTAVTAAFIAVNIIGSMTHIWFFFCGFAQVIVYLIRNKGMSRGFFAIFAASYLPFFLLWGGILHSQMLSHSNDWMFFKGDEVEMTLQNFTAGKFDAALKLFLIPVLAGFFVEVILKKNTEPEIHGSQLLFLTAIIMGSLLVPFLISFFKPIYVMERGPVIAAAPFALLIGGYFLSVSYKPVYYMVFSLFCVYISLKMYTFTAVDYNNDRTLSKIIMNNTAGMDKIAIYGEMKRQVNYNLNVFKYKGKLKFIYCPDIMEYARFDQWNALDENKKSEIENQYYGQIDGKNSRLLFVFKDTEAAFEPLKSVYAKLNSEKQVIKKVGFIGSTLVVYK